VAVRVGTSGWSYDDWVGPVYPPGLPPERWLPFYADRFPTVEVNSTYYRTPSRATVLGWLAKVRDRSRFEFSVKAPQTLTHEVLVSGAPGEAARLAGEWAAVVPRPLAAAGRLGAVLLQLSPAFRRSPESLARLEEALDALAEFPVAVEPRHRSWVEADGLARDLIALLDARKAAVVAVDGPSFPAVVAGDAPHAFVRFHGRNDDVWFKGRAVEEDPDDPRMNRYDYAYKDADLEPWAERIATLARRKEVVRVYFNNHPEGNGIRDGSRLVAMLGERGAPVDAPSPGNQRSLDLFGGA
jgi:uncharacterized protein YecE (DUF72 family)